jgi:alpha-amylase/alpha-mannosidase (GH57 family)
MKKINFLFGIHNHQPVGNFDFVFSAAYDQAYRPFLQVLENFPNIKIGLHLTGILIDWLKENRPELLGMISKLVKRGQIEMMTGGYYEPILSIIPEEDRLGQIKLLTRTIKDLFDYEPHGMWLAERVWEPTMPTSLVKAGVNYTVIDDTHFKYAGLTDDQLIGYYLTEDLGNAVVLFPISKRLRYTIPFEDPERTIEHLAAMASEDGENIMVFADDGEKFGVWPNTHHHVYHDKWLERFFRLLTENSSWINMIHFSDAIRLFKPRGKIYLPTASYAEMMHWSLFPDTFQAYEDFEHYLKSKNTYEDFHVFIRGGFWRNFLAKYTEVNNMHKKMLRVSNKLWRLSEVQQKKAESAFKKLWAGQCNCPYWHGVFGGLYLSHLRDAIYNNLIQAETIVDKVTRAKMPRIELTDLNVDGSAELIVETKNYNAYFSLMQGGMLYELDYKPVAKNILDSMTRRQEGYHKKLAAAVVPGHESQRTASIHDLVLAKEPDLLSKLHYDFYERKSFIDHFLNDNTTLQSFASAQYEEKGDFFNQEYQLRSRKISPAMATVKLYRIGKAGYRGEQEMVRIDKNIKFSNNNGTITAYYTLTNNGQNPLQLWFGVEFNFALQAGHADDRYYYVKTGEIGDTYLDSMGEICDVQFIGLRDEWRKLDLQLEMSKKSTIWRLPIETISLSEAGFERVYQSSVVLPNWQLELKDNWQVVIKLKMKTIKN